MKKLKLIALVTMMFSTSSFADTQTRAHSLKLSDPTKPAKIEAEIYYGSITVMGYEGETIEISANFEPLKGAPEDLEKITRRVERQVRRQMTGTEDSDNKKRSMEGLKKVKNVSFNLEIEEQDNHVEISSDHTNKMVNLTLKVPFSASLELELYKGGDIRIDSVAGNIEVENYAGKISADNISGPIVAETHHQDIEVVFNQFDNATPSSLTTHRGNVDITVPSVMKANIQVQTYKGEIYSGLDNDFKLVEKIEQSSKGRRKTEITMGGMMAAKANGGGQKLSLTTYSGDIYVRKAQ